MGFFRDTTIVFNRSLRLSLQNPVWMLISLMQPILYLTLFGPLLQQIAQAPGFPPGDAWQVFVPGLLVQLGIFGAAFVGFGIIAEWRAGVLDRMMVTPANRVALIAGRVLRDVLTLVVQGLILIGAAYLFGLRVPLWAIFASLGIVALLAASFSFLSNAAGLWLKSEDALAPLVNSFALPVLLLSGILLPMSFAPVWLQVVSDINPIKHIVEAIRAVFRSDITDASVALGVGLSVLLVIFSAWLGTRVFRAQTR
jgi:ABC-2 type transport system permease protein